MSLVVVGALASNLLFRNSILIEGGPSSAAISSSIVISYSAVPSSSASEDKDDCTDEPEFPPSVPQLPSVKPTGTGYPTSPGYSAATPGASVPGPKYPVNNTRPGYERGDSAPTAFTTSCTETEGTAPLPTVYPGKGRGGYYQPTSPQPGPGGKGDDASPENTAPEASADSGPEYGPVRGAPGAGRPTVPATPGSDSGSDVYLPVPGFAGPTGFVLGDNSGDIYNPVVEAAASSNGEGLVTFGVFAIAIAAGAGVF
ncbi:hypothetical protein V8F20_008274 [Naviculisporaceae sp. PSN 640]